jgi:hypothetical protein
LGHASVTFLGAALASSFNTENQPNYPSASSGSYRDFRGNATLGQIITVENTHFRFAGVEMSELTSNTTDDGVPAKYNDLAIHLTIKDRNALPVELDCSMFQIESYTQDGKFSPYYSVRLSMTTQVLKASRYHMTKSIQLPCFLM